VDIFAVSLTMQQLFCLGMIAFGGVAWYLLQRTRDRSADPSFPGPAPESKS
jgi:hypothetical protein